MNIITIKAVCEMAKTFGEAGHISMLTLLKESGYLENADLISEMQILEYVRKHSDLINTWLQYAEDKRTSQGWYVKSPVENQKIPDVWIVGYYPNGEINEFRDVASACAFFIKQEMEQLRQGIRRQDNERVE
jgi:hypothetical protein